MRLAMLALCPGAFVICGSRGWLGSEPRRGVIGTSYADTSSQRHLSQWYTVLSWLKGLEETFTVPTNSTGTVKAESHIWKWNIKTCLLLVLLWRMRLPLPRKCLVPSRRNPPILSLQLRSEWEVPHHQKLRQNLKSQRRLRKRLRRSHLQSPHQCLLLAQGTVPWIPPHPQMKAIPVSQRIHNVASSMPLPMFWQTNYPDDGQGNCHHCWGHHRGSLMTPIFCPGTLTLHQSSSGVWVKANTWCQNGNNCSHDGWCWTYAPLRGKPASSFPWAQIAHSC